ncbi:hypothetical protein H2200_010596 [Cladophialophora chaetospira]|uniref:Arsenite methyltransferase n=1 Tax=Cladophialophora chaetospira TaxID=386627 RepID=A0AA38X1S1_9EURO|nr:hypothetical protein H2200_010596 [Cladophialophora chaetospira]
MNSTTVYETVNNTYSLIASNAEAGKAEEGKNSQIASSFGYSAEELASLPSGTNLGLSCGNPLATANLKPDETLVDLGSGGGLDCLVAARQMLKADSSPSGKVFGIDRSETMVALAQRNAGKANLPDGLVQFIQAPISEIPLQSSTVDLIVSNCVINLVPDEDKPIVFKEMHRLLKPGGRVAVSDLLAKTQMPDHIRQDAALLCGCLAGASLVEEYQRWFEEAGFQKESIVFVNTEKDLNVYQELAGRDGCCAVEPEPVACATEKKSAGCCSKDTQPKSCGADKPQSGGKVDFNEWVASYQIYAVK